MSKLLSFGHHHTIRERGQSLVEFSLFLALVFIPMLAGLVEVSQYMVTQNRISTAARAAARFGANGGQDEGMVIVAQSTVSQTVRMNLSPDVWDIWSIRGRIDNTGTD
ncbi:MAG: pilus assembly protein, partial [Anaerolineales bacterium]|nr:pilus assembly protein [Anaerolineales bacterium]